MQETTSSLARAADAVPPHAWFVVSAIFHYLEAGVLLDTRLCPQVRR
jgi:hypothetical protein